MIGVCRCVTVPEHNCETTVPSLPLYLGSGDHTQVRREKQVIYLLLSLIGPMCCALKDFG